MNNNHKDGWINIIIIMFIIDFILLLRLAIKLWMGIELGG